MNPLKYFPRNKLVQGENYYHQFSAIKYRSFRCILKKFLIHTIEIQKKPASAFVLRQILHLDDHLFCLQFLVYASLFDVFYVPQNKLNHPKMVVPKTLS